MVQTCANEENESNPKWIRWVTIGRFHGLGARRSTELTEHVFVDKLTRRSVLICTSLHSYPTAMDQWSLVNTCSRRERETGEGPNQRILVLSLTRMQHHYPSFLSHLKVKDIFTLSEIRRVDWPLWPHIRNCLAQNATLQWPMWFLSLFRCARLVHLRPTPSFLCLLPNPIFFLYINIKSEKKKMTQYRQKTTTARRRENESSPPFR